MTERDRLAERFQQECMRRCPKAAKHVDADVDLLDFFHCSGQVSCPVCGHLYYDHPHHAKDDFLHVTCQGKLVKL